MSLECLQGWWLCQFHGQPVLIWNHKKVKPQFSTFLLSCLFPLIFFHFWITLTYMGINLIYFPYTSYFIYQYNRGCSGCQQEVRVTGKLTLDIVCKRFRWGRRGSIPKHYIVGFLFFSLFCFCFLEGKKERNKQCNSWRCSVFIQHDQI